MQAIGFSTGAIAHSDFRLALDMLRKVSSEAIELSALRLAELVPLMKALKSLSLSQYKYISVHAPSRFHADEESFVISELSCCIDRQWPIVIHPDTIHDFTKWQAFGSLLLVENMDKRKPIGRTAKELDVLFEQLPEAKLCFDIAHARQVDSSMIESYRILTLFKNRIAQIHLSEVNTASKHERLSFGAIQSYKQVIRFLPQTAPIILESPVVSDVSIGEEIDRTRQLFSSISNL